jgi:hypothetical protein
LTPATAGEGAFHRNDASAQLQSREDIYTIVQHAGRREKLKKKTRISKRREKQRVKAKAEMETKSLTNLKTPLSRGRRICSGTGTRLSVGDSDCRWSDSL